jgi:acyl-CoA thioesterase
LIYDRNGRLVASTAQEGLIRVVEETSADMPAVPKASP